MVMIIAVVIAVGVMMAFATPISDFVHHHPTVKMLALAFLILIGVNLVAEGLGQHIPKGYIYTAMAFSLLVEFLNIRSRKTAEEPPVELRSPYAVGDGTGVPLPEDIQRPGAASVPLTRPGA
jgi:predicted tellurium resistance membrane protein TerC